MEFVIRNEFNTQLRKPSHGTFIFELELGLYQVHSSITIKRDSPLQRYLNYVVY